MPTFLLMLLSGNENSERESNPKPEPVYMYLSQLTLLDSFTALNEQSFRVKSVFKSRDHVSNS